jgi:predicted HicB family RNase H-like nuclease
MNEQTMQYKGYTALVTYTPQDQYYTGKVIGIEHTILFSGSTIEEADANFREMIDDYPDMCADQDVEPNQPPNEIMVPIPTELYAKASCRAKHEGQTVNSLINHAVEDLVAQSVGL